jgi:hypothetical protein
MMLSNNAELVFRPGSAHGSKGFHPARGAGYFSGVARLRDPAAKLAAGHEENGQCHYFGRSHYLLRHNAEQASRLR